MTKIMLVEDDKSLREIYGVRLLAEGYDIVSAGDGEEALAMAIKERPQLIISDVMMPKVSGYDMLDILRSTSETKNIRVIMMTALSSEEQRMRAESLGADRYLVKSQVGIEDAVRVVHEVLGDAPTAATPQTATTAAPAQAPSQRVGVPSMQPPAQTVNYQTTPAPVTSPVSQQPPAQSLPFTPVPALTTPANTAPQQRFAERSFNDTPRPASIKTRVIQPIDDPSTTPIDINDLLDKELAKEAGLADGERPAVESANQEKEQMEEQLNAFTAPEPTPVVLPEPPNISSAQPYTQILPTPGVSAVPAPPSPIPPSVAPTPVTPVAQAAVPAVNQPYAASPSAPVATTMPPAPTIPPRPTVSVAPQQQAQQVVTPTPPSAIPAQNSFTTLPPVPPVPHA